MCTIHSTLVKIQILEKSCLCALNPGSILLFFMRSRFGNVMFMSANHGFKLQVSSNVHPAYTLICPQTKCKSWSSPVHGEHGCTALGCSLHDSEPLTSHIQARSSLQFCAVLVLLKKQANLGAGLSRQTAFGKRVHTGAGYRRQTAKRIQQKDALYKMTESSTLNIQFRSNCG